MRIDVVLTINLLLILRSHSALFSKPKITKNTSPKIQAFMTPFMITSISQTYLKDLVVNTIN